MKPNPMPVISDSSKARFWKFVKISGANECWEWQGAKFGPLKCRYGAFRLGGPNRKAHRVSWKIHTGREPIDRILHTCDNPGCVNPAHLFEGSSLDNSRDMVAKGRAANGDKNGSRIYPDRLIRGDSHWVRTNPEKMAQGDSHWTRGKMRPRGTAMAWHKLSENDVLDIRALKFMGAVAKDISKAFGITRENIYFIWKRKTWSHI